MGSWLLHFYGSWQPHVAITKTQQLLNSFTQGLLHSRHSANISFNHQQNPVRWAQLSPLHRWETEAQRVLVIYSRTHGRGPQMQCGPLCFFQSPTISSSYQWWKHPLHTLTESLKHIFNVNTYSLVFRRRIGEPGWVPQHDKTGEGRRQDSHSGLCDSSVKCLQRHNTKPLMERILFILNYQVESSRRKNVRMP